MRMSQYKFTTQSQQDLIRIRHFTSEHWGADQSVHYLKELRKILQLLSEMPLMGKKCLDDLGENVYRFPFNSHVIYYLMLSAEEIVIVAIQSMVPGKHIEKRL
jgi:toxin ParE1/3/4